MTISSPSLFQFREEGRDRRCELRLERASQRVGGVKIKDVGVSRRDDDSGAAAFERADLDAKRGGLRGARGVRCPAKRARGPTGIQLGYAPALFCPAQTSVAERSAPGPTGPFARALQAALTPRRLRPPQPACLAQPVPQPCTLAKFVEETGALAVYPFFVLRFSLLDAEKPYRFESYKKYSKHCTYQRPF